jgi:hypothetical protein
MSLFKKSLNGKRLSETMADFVDRAERSPFSVVGEGMNASLHRMQRVSEFAGRMSHPSWQTDQFIFKHGGGYA